MVRPLARSLARVGALAFAVGCAATDYNVTKEAARLAVTPGLVDLGAVSPGTENAAIVRLSHIAGADAIRIVSLNVLVLEGDGFTVVDPGVATIEPEASVDVTVLWAPGADGLHLGRLEIATDEVEDSLHTVDVRGSVGAGTLRAFPPVLDFGPVGVGDDAVATITIENAGTADLTLSAPTLDAPGFSTTWAGGPLAAGTRAEEAGELRVEPSVLRYGDEEEESEDEDEGEGEEESEDEGDASEGGESGDDEEEGSGEESAIVRERTAVPA